MTTYNQTQIENRQPARQPITIVAMILIAIVAIGIAFSSSFSGTLFSNASPLSNAMTKWEAQAAENYAYELQVSCFCFPDITRPVNIVVTDGVVQSVTYVDDGTAADVQLFAGYSTVDKLFERLENAQAQNPASFDVTFDAQYGVPQSVSIDIDEMMADEEIYFTVSNFSVLP